MKPKENLIEIFEKILGRRENLIMSCGSGVTACIIGLAAYVAGYRNIAIYDGSWTEWAQDESRTIYGNSK